MKNSKRVCSFLLGTAMVLGGVSSAAAASTVYVGNQGFDADEIGNKDAYKEGFQKYLAENIDESLILSLDTGLENIVFDANDYGNAPEGTNVVEFGKQNPAQAPKDAPVWDGKGEPGQEKPPVEGELKVESISAINATTVSVTFSGEGAPAEAVQITDFTPSPLVDGANTITFTYEGKEFTTTVNFEAKVEEGFTLTAGKTELNANGSDSTTLTAVIGLENGEKDENFTGIVDFRSAQGATFARTSVAFQNGEASVQVTSKSSSETITDTITATIREASDAKYNGMEKTIILTYKPVSKDDDVNLNERSFVTTAESGRTDRVTVGFNHDIDFEKIYSCWEDGNADISIKQPAKGVERNAEDILDIVKIDNRKVQILFMEHKALYDNAETEVSIKDKESVKEENRIFIERDPAKFFLVDAIAPEALKVTTPEYNLLVAQFTEPVAGYTNAPGSETDEAALKPENWVINGTTLTVEHVEIFLGRTPEDDNFATPKNTWDFAYDKENGKDSRNYVSLRLKAKGLELLRAAGKDNLLQATNIIDYAGKTDITGQNKAQTQEFVFKTPALPGAPTFNMTQDSVEQYKLSFSEPVVKNTNATSLVNGIEDVDQNAYFKVERKVPKTVAEDGWVDVSEDVQVINIDGKNKDFLFELTRDWTEILQTKTTTINYYTPEYNQLRVTVNTHDGETELIKSERTDVAAQKYESFVFDLKLDAESPEIATAEQVEKTTNVKVEMSEPIQIPKNEEKNITGSTAQTKRFDITSIPMPTFEFVKADQSKTIEGILIDDSLAVDDMEFVIAPKEGELTAGEWTVYIRSIMDDVGNTSATTTANLTIKAVEDQIVKGEPRIIWAGVLDNHEDYDIVAIQYGTEMSIDALRTNIYTINGAQIPAGTKTVRKEAKYATDSKGNDLTGTLIEIKLPNTFLGNASNNNIVLESNNVITVDSTLKSEEGENIIAPKTVEMSYAYKAEYKPLIAGHFEQYIGGSEEEAQTDKEIVESVKTMGKNAEYDEDTKKLTVTFETALPTGVDVLYRSAVQTVDNKTVIIDVYGDDFDLTYKKDEESVIETVYTK
ncbi:hypothetical protein [Anaerophilus nitritogenes]|uniref:hypothetical protein n=1 Tax=Anaerophilus nitritogenes TaxID=2498136 RepID=UPI00101DF42F|nr:hypothetical protein [Anaerophilus nitritogenes]